MCTCICRSRSRWRCSVCACVLTNIRCIRIYIVHSHFREPEGFQHVRSHHGDSSGGCRSVLLLCCFCCRCYRLRCCVSVSLYRRWGSGWSSQIDGDQVHLAVNVNAVIVVIINIVFVIIVIVAMAVIIVLVIVATDKILGDLFQFLANPQSATLFVPAISVSASASISICVADALHGNIVIAIVIVFIGIIKLKSCHDDCIV
mmetsp:Transcript_1562/g.3455  ORF Transcript_1562/g.3455 Transcript_1562/m.3455 type:complete len:202 (+) Transcript_1562:452-1057(+)